MADTNNESFVTAFYCVLDPSSGRLTYCNAGHNPPIYYDAEQDEFIKLTRTGIFLGFDEQKVYEQKILA